MLRLTAATVLLLPLVAIGCNDADGDPAATDEMAEVSADAEMVNCVICGDHEFPREPDTAMVSYEGENYFFCSDHCKETFEKDPAQYAAAE